MPDRKIMVQGQPGQKVNETQEQARGSHLYCQLLRRLRKEDCSPMAALAKA
jgi:hypothetical protein